MFSMHIKHLSKRLFYLVFRFLPACFIIIAFAIAKPALESLRASAESLECYCPSCPENLLPEAGIQALGQIKVEIAGAVKKPGIYELSLGQRRADLLLAAGGLSTEASLVFMAKTFNLSIPLEDGEKIYIPYTWEEQWQLTAFKEHMLSENGEEEQKTNQNKESLISINSAESKSLETLPGIGEKRAEDIISNRPYSSINELISKEVLTQNQFDSIKELISI
jgi:competence protein ComEA